MTLFIDSPICVLLSKLTFRKNEMKIIRLIHSPGQGMNLSLPHLCSPSRNRVSGFPRKTQGYQSFESFYPQITQITWMIVDSDLFLNSLLVSVTLLPRLSPSLLGILEVHSFPHTGPDVRIPAPAPPFGSTLSLLSHKGFATTTLTIKRM